MTRGDPTPPSHDEIAAEKHAHRKHARSTRQALHPDACAAAATAASERLLALDELASVAVVLAYSANAEEIDPSEALDGLRERARTIALPRVESQGVLGVHRYEHGDELEEGAFGILQPLESAPRLPLETIDAAIVPGVAFDLECRRLGYGGGYYDRLLSQLRADCARIGYAYDEQVVERLPHHEHDEQMNVVVTPTRVLRAHRRGSGGS